MKAGTNSAVEFLKVFTTTPYTARNFAIGGPTAREGQLDRFFLQKRHFIYKLSVKKQRTGQKTGKNPPKKVVFPAPPISWLSLDRF